MCLFNPLLTKITVGSDIIVCQPLMLICGSAPCWQSNIHQKSQSILLFLCSLWGTVGDRSKFVKIKKEDTGPAPQSGTIQTDTSSSADGWVALEFKPETSLVWKLSWASTVDMTYREDVLGCFGQVRTWPLTSSICNNRVFGVKILWSVLWEVKAEFALCKQFFDFTLIYIHNDGNNFHG